MKTTQKTEQNIGQRNRAARSTLTNPKNNLQHAPEINTKSKSQMSSVFTSVAPLSAQTALLRLAQLETQLGLNLISNFAAGIHNVYGNPFVPLCLLQAAVAQRAQCYTMHQPPGMVTFSHSLQRKNTNSMAYMAGHTSPTGNMLSPVTSQEISPISNKKIGMTVQGNLPAKDKKALDPSSSGAINHLERCFSFRPTVDCSQSQAVNAIKGSANVMTPTDRDQVSKLWESTSLELEPKQPATVPVFPSQNLAKVLASHGLSLEDLELLSHYPDSQLTTETLPFLIKEIQQRKGAKVIKHASPAGNMPGKVIEYGHASRSHSDQAELTGKSSYTNGKHYSHSQWNQKIRHRAWQKTQNMSQSVSTSCSWPTSPALPSTNGHSCIPHTDRPVSDLNHDDRIPCQSKVLKRVKESSGNGSNFLHKRHAEVMKWRPGSVCFSSSIRHCSVSRDHNKARTYRTQSLSTSNAKRRSHHPQSYLSLKSGVESKANITNEHINVKTSTQTRGVIRVSGIPLDYPESELIKTAAPFGQPVEVLSATEIDMATHLHLKKALVMLPTEFSAQEMVKIYSAIPVHMRQQSLELVSQSIDPSSSFSLFHAFVGPSTSNGLLTPLDQLLVVCNVPNQPSAATGVLRLLKPFGKVLRTLVFGRNKVNVEPCHWHTDCLQMVVEMESAAAALSVYEWSQKIPCLYCDHRLYFFRGPNIQKNKAEGTMQQSNKSSKEKETHKTESNGSSTNEKEGDHINSQKRDEHEPLSVAGEDTSESGLNKAEKRFSGQTEFISCGLITNNNTFPLEKKGEKGLQIKINTLLKNRKTAVRKKTNLSFPKGYSLLPFTGTAIGLEFLEPKSGFFCKACGKFYAGGDEVKDIHCRSFKHYKNMEISLQRWLKKSNS